MIPNRRPQPFLTQLFDLTLMELTSWRWSWRSMLIIAAVAPILSIAALGVFARDAGETALVYVLCGNMVVSLMFGILDKVQSHIVYLRFVGALDFFATLPVRRFSLMFAIVLSFWLLSLPSLAMTTLAGALLLNIPLHPHPLLLLVLPMCSIPLAGIGALIGALARDPQESNSWTMMFTLLLAGLGPVIVPPDRLPPLLVTLGRFSPATYAASAMRQVMVGPITSQLWLDLGILTLTALVVFAIVNRTLTWRQE